MFGLKHALSDSSLYLFHDMVENLLVTAEQTLSETSQDKISEIEQLTTTITYYRQELTNFESEIKEQQKIFFQFSIEELYSMYGQYDKFVGIEFHKFSEATKKYGRNIGGIFIYGKNERQELEDTLTFETVPRTNGLVKLDVSSNYNLTNEQIKELIEVGFNSGDIYEISASNTTLINSYAQKGKKEIPNTINLTIDTSGTDPCKLILYNLNMRLNYGGVLIEGEWNQFCGFSICYSPKLEKVEFIKSKSYDKDGKIKREVRFYELVAKKINSDITEDELNEFSQLLRERRIARFEILKSELKKNNINSLEKFKEEHPSVYTEIYKTALIFDDEVLTFSKSSIPVYWDFKTYLHIYLRHCDELQPDGHFKSKTPFSYHQKDIRRILTIAVEELEDKIQDRLSQGLDFRTYGEKALYFNGNYYSMRIESNGRIDSFYPNESK
jgi:hypothetical protein